MNTEKSQGLDVLAIWNDADPAHEAEYHRWYWGQHLPERLSVPGFLGASRYQAVEATPNYFTWYFVRDVEVLRSPYYLERLANPSEWTQRVMPWFRNMIRCACRVTVNAGRGIGGVTAVVRISGVPENKRGNLTSSLRDAVPRLMESAAATGITRAQLWETDREISDQRTPERAMRGDADRLIDCAIVLHCPTIENARAAAKQLQAVVSPLLDGAALDGPHIYTLLHTLSVVG